MLLNRKQNTMGTTLLLGLSILLSGCGGGGGSGSGGGSQAPIATYKIVGNITSPGATVAFSGTGNASTTVDPFGNYSVRLASGSYTITPTNPGFIFEPLCQAVTVASGNLNGLDFAATIPLATPHSVSGQVKNGSTGIPWMKISIAAAFAPITGSTFTDNSGNYQFAGVPDGRYVITADVPSAYASYLFAPDIILFPFTVSGTNLPGQNFTALPRGSGSATVDF